MESRPDSPAVFAATSFQRDPAFTAKQCLCSTERQNRCVTPHRRPSGKTSPGHESPLDIPLRMPMDFLLPLKHPDFHRIKSAQNHGADKRPDNHKDGDASAGDPACLKHLLGVVALGDAQLAHHVAGGIDAAGQPRCGQDGDREQAHGQPAGDSGRAEHLGDDLDFRNSRRFDSKSADDRGDKHDSRRAVCRRAAQQLGDRVEAAAQRNQIQQDVDRHEYHEHLGLGSHALGHGIHHMVDIHAADDPDDRGQNDHHDQRIAGSLLGEDAVNDQGDERNQKNDGRPALFRRGLHLADILRFIQMIGFLAFRSALGAVGREPHAAQPEDRKRDHRAQHQLAVGQVGHFLRHQGDAGERPHHQADFPGDLKQRGDDGGGDPQRRHDRDQDRGDHRVAAAQSPQQAADQNGTDDQGDLRLCLRIHADPFYDPVNQGMRDPGLRHQDAEPRAGHDDDADQGRAGTEACRERRSQHLQVLSHHQRADDDAHDDARRIVLPTEHHDDVNHQRDQRQQRGSMNQRPTAQLHTFHTKYLL